MGTFTSKGAIRAGILVLTLITLTFATLFRLYSSFQRDISEETRIGFLASLPPRSPQDVLLLRDVLLKSSADSNPALIVAAFILLYITLQTFAIPGTIALSLLGGAIFGTRNGLLLVSVVSTLGSVSAYTLSNLIGRRLSLTFWPERIKKFELEVSKRSNEMLGYIIFLRLSPLLPNTMINVASPIVGVKIQPFIIGTFLGCFPNNFMAVTAGQRLSELRSFSDLYNFRLVSALAVAALMPIAVQRLGMPFRKE